MAMLIAILSAFVAGVLLLLAAIQTLVGACYFRKLLRHKGKGKTPQYCPRAAVVLSIRGPDPFLDDTLLGLIHQDYEHYTIFLVVDSESDPVMRQLKGILDQYQPENVVISILKDHKETCSLKCSALIQAVEELDNSYEVVAFIDGDAIPHPSWLRNLVAPLEDSSIGVSTGNRWYVPKDWQWGSLVRYLWNAGAVVQVWLNGIVWAGSMAMRRVVAQDTELLSAWSKSLSVDGTLTRHIKEKGYKVHFTPNVMMFNEEGIMLPRFMEWVQRQMVAAMSCGSGWGIIALHAFNLSVMQLAAFTLLLWAIVVADPAATTWLVAGLAAYWGTALVALFAMESAMRQIARSNSVSVSPLTWGMIIRFLPGMLLTHVVYPYALAIAIFRRRVKWRGIEYEVNGINDIRMLNYHPCSGFRDKRARESVV